MPTVLNSCNSTLMDLANLVGEDIGPSFDMIETNLDLIREQ